MTQDVAPERSPRDHLNFRHDINALRAIAVVSVVLFHFHVPWAWGGFVGVDVFFVISGYLMTQIILKRQAAGTFSIWSFYADRGRRILPALWAVSAAVLLLGCVLMDPLTLQGLARSVASSLTFLSNFDYAAQGGYFGGAAEENWMLHTWSLSVEWQFYLLYPLLFLILARFAANHVRTWLVVLCALSLILCAVVPLFPFDAPLRFSFFLLPTRAWELLIGGLVVVFPLTRLGKGARTAVLVVGLAAILISILTFSRITIWPSLATVLPVIGTAMVIAAARSDAAWTKFPGVPALGRWSYSIYLWHWPVVALLDFLELQGPLVSAAGIAISLVLGAASYFAIERGLAVRLFRMPRGGLIGIAAVTGLVVIAAAVFATHGLRPLKFPGDKPEAVEMARRITLASKDWTFPKSCADYRVTGTQLRLCRQGGGGPVSTLVIGDSYGEEIAPRYASLPKGASDPAVLFVTRPGCAPLPDVQLGGSTKNCARSLDEALAMADAGRFSKIMVIGSWLGAFAEAAGEPARGRVCFPSALGCRASGDPAVYDRDAAASFALLSDHIRRWRAAGTEVTVVKTFPQSRDAAPKRLLATLYREGTLANVRLDTKDMRETAAYSNRLVDGLGRTSGATLIDPIDHLCIDECPLVENGTPLFYDVSHIRSSAVAGPEFAFLDSSILPGHPAQ